ncbi:serine/threonine-protein kinase [Amycolatopsis sp. lyj-84]|uniref:serine/threonine-protein kinase n=1 Tax=Amycolatopsis sp. lyj-84 TaxID=2789284 RepID=UPI00397DFE11
MKPLNPGEPRQVGPYRIIAEIGEGGMGRVVLGLAPDGRLVAVKQLHAQFAHDPRFRERFRREVATSRLVSGAYTAAVMDADAEAETPWLASVFVTGPSLKEAVDAAGPLPAASVRLLASGLAAALTEIHRAGLIHRDLKPSNVILTSDGPRVIDFGIARVAEEAQELTGTGAIIGSPAFMSPEQAGSGQVTGASDVFSLGAILVMAATGRGPFTGPTAPQTLYNVVHAAADFTDVPDEIRRLAEPCLAKDPARRPTPEQILDHLGPVPPGMAPWPAAVHARIRQQDTEVRSVLGPAAPDLAAAAEEDGAAHEEAPVRRARRGRPARGRRDRRARSLRRRVREARGAGYGVAGGERGAQPGTPAPGGSVQGARRSVRAGVRDPQAGNGADLPGPLQVHRSPRRLFRDPDR